jgi:hypothetical protein
MVMSRATSRTNIKIFALMQMHKRRRPKRWRRKMLKRMPTGKRKNASDKKIRIRRPQ